MDAKMGRANKSNPGNEGRSGEMENLIARAEMAVALSRQLRAEFNVIDRLVHARESDPEKPSIFGG
jgi:hypothetical protein